MKEFPDLRNTVDRNSLAFLVSGLLLGSVLVFLGVNYNSVNGDKVAQDLESTLEQSTGQDLEIVKVDQENGLYKVQLKDPEDQLSTYYVTRDGKLVAQESGFTDFSRFKQQTAAQANFSSCMLDRNVVMFGNRSQRATLAQIQVLGGVNQVVDIYADVNNQPVLQQAARLGVSQTPAFYYDNSTAQGLQTISQLEDFTGCEYSFNQSGS